MIYRELKHLRKMSMVRRNEEGVEADKVVSGVNSLRPIGAEISAGKDLEPVLEGASKADRGSKARPAWVWLGLCKKFDIPLQPGNSTFLEIIGKNCCQINCLQSLVCLK